MKAIKLPRRTVLKGLSGVTIALPFLEAMVDNEAYAQTSPPKRYLVFFDGQSTGADNDTRHNLLVPDTVGQSYDLKLASQPLSMFGDVRKDVTIVSGLKIPTAFDNGGTVPAGGRHNDFHISSLSPLLTGTRVVTGYRPSGPSSDQVVANFLAGNTTFKSLVYRVQADWYLSVSAPYGRDIISYRTDQSGNPVAIPSQTSPRAAFSALFGNFTPPGVDPAAAAKMELELRQRKSILDLVRGNTERLMSKLGSADRIRMQRHLDEIRDLERRVAAIPPPQTSTCKKPADPGADPALGGAQLTDGNGNNTYSQNLGYSDEDTRARAFIDLIHMAMACDLTRVASLQMTMAQSHMNMYALTGDRCDVHELGHGGSPGGTEAVSRGIAWHMKHFAYLVSKFRDTPEGGGSMLDNTAIVYLLEGGHGFDPGGNKQNSSHSTENMVVLLAGRAGGLKTGIHLPAPGLHPANVLVTAMRAVGHTGNSLGEVSGEVPGLRG